MPPFTHRSIITWGIAFITLVLVVLFLRDDRNSAPASLQNELQELSPSVSANPTVDKSKNDVQSLSPSDTAKVTTILAEVTPSLSPRLSPLSPSMSPLSPRLSPLSPSLSPTQTPIVTPSLAPLLSPQVTAPPHGASHVVINEVAWMGTQASSTDEWIELYNPTGSSIDLTGWVLRSETDDSPHIALSKTIVAGGYYLIERTNDSTVSNISADLFTSFGKGGLNNSGEVLVLLDPSGAEVDRTGSGAAWPAGDAIGRRSMERISALISGVEPSNWATEDGSAGGAMDASGSPIWGTPRARNSVAQ